MSNFEIHKQNEIKKLDIEVKALIAFVTHAVIRSMRIDAVQRLHEIAFPMALAEKINQEVLE